MSFATEIVREVSLPSTASIISSPIEVVMESPSLPSSLPTEWSGLLLNEWTTLAVRGHSSSIAKTAQGFVIATNGRCEKEDQKSIWILRENKGRWVEEELLAPDQFVSEGHPFCSSPVLYQAQNNEYALFFRVGTNPAAEISHTTKTMRSVMCISQDGCASFKRVDLPVGIVGPTKAKPLYVYNRYIVYGSSVQKEGEGRGSTAAKIELYDLVAKQWFSSPEINGSQPFGAIEPALCTFEKEGELFIRMICRNRSKGQALTAVFMLPKDPSEGFTWPVSLEPSTLPNCDSGLDLVDLSGQSIRGKTVKPGVVIAFGNFLDSRNSLEMAVSSDGGASWSLPFIIEKHSGEFPSCEFDPETGLIHVTYASAVPDNPSNKDLLSIRHCIIDPALSAEAFFQRD